MNITLVNTWRVIDSKGGTEKVFCDMANELSRRGYDVTAICHDPKIGVPGFPLSTNIHFVNAFKKPSYFDKKSFIKIRALHFNKKERQRRRNNLLAKWKANNLSRALDVCDKADVVIAFQPEAAYLVRGILKSNVPLVTMYHFTPERFNNDDAFHAFFKDAVTSSNIVHVLMPEYVPIAQRFHPGTPVVHIPNIAPQYSEPSSLSSKTIINIARIALQKRPELLVEAFALLKDRFPDWTCEWWGETHVEPGVTERVNALITKYGLENRFLLKGKTNDVESKLRTGSIFAFPSSFEGQSLSLLEAMAMGLPIAGCVDCPSVNTIIRDSENGVLTKPTPEAYAEGLAKLMENEDLRCKLGSQAKEDMKAYSPERVWNQWEKLLRSLTAIG
ncbi:MAG: glycosyltransferase [Sutterella wadsworthensis]